MKNAFSQQPLLNVYKVNKMNVLCFLQIFLLVCALKQDNWATKILTHFSNMVAKKVERF
jgi:hypothetical protein